MLNQFTSWLGQLITGWFAAAWDFIADAAISTFGLLLGAVGTLIASIPLPDWMTGGLSTFWTVLPAGMLYLLSAAKVPAALGLIGSGFGFRLLRKVFTLFQW